MTTETTIRQSLESRLPELRNNTIVIENQDNLDLKNVENGILIVYATWSGPAMIHSIQTITALYQSDYSGQIIVADADCMTPDFQVDLFGQVCHGWGEIFVIHHGKIVEKYFSKNSFVKFKTGYDN